MSMHQILDDVAATLASLLESNLPQVSQDWCQSCAIDRLSIQRQRLVAERRVESPERIKGSSQHRGIIELHNDPIKERSFPDWLMGLLLPTASELLQLGSANWSSRLADESLDNSTGFRLLENFWRGSQ